MKMILFVGSRALIFHDEWRKKEAEVRVGTGGHCCVPQFTPSIDIWIF